jgi:hypothetical protein
LNGVAYRIATGRMQYRSDTHDVTDTEFPGGGASGKDPRRDRGVGLGEAELTLTAFLDPAVALHIPPLNIRIQQTIPLVLIYANGLDNAPDVFGNVLVDDVTKDPVGDPQQPNRVSFHGFSGFFNEAGTVSQIGAAAVAGTTAPLPFTPVYSNGTAGVNATLTAGTNGALTIDGHTCAVNDTVLIKDQADATQNGLYSVTIAGGVGAAYILTRAGSMNTPAAFPGAFVNISSGTVNALTLWVCTAVAPVIVGTTAIKFLNVG